MNNFLIFVCCHNKQKILETENIKPILVGAEKSKLDIYPYKDNTGENISLKNPNYNELTAQYWAWKNLPTNVTHVGFFHYRRYLSLKNTIFPKKFLSNFAFLMSYIFGFNKKNILKIQDFDIVLPKKTSPLVFQKNKIKTLNMREHFEKSNPNVPAVIQEIILEKMPEYKEALEISWGEKKSYFKNMFIMNRFYFDNYMNFLFTILFEFERKNKFTSQSRIFGFTAERLLNVYINHLKLQNKKVKILEVDLIRKLQLDISKERFLKQITKLKRRLNFSYIKYVFSKLIKKG